MVTWRYNKPLSHSPQAGLFAARSSTYTVDMIDERFGQSPKQGQNEAFRFIQDRLKAASKNVEDSVVKLLAESDGLGQVFLALWRDKLQGRRKVYMTMDDFRKRDAAVKQMAGLSLPQEHAQRSSLLRRPDQGQPSALEYWLLTLLTPEQWQELCADIPEALDESTASGALSFRNVIENVISDEPRTKAFIGAVRNQMQKFNDEPITIYDVGCGPFPVLAMAAAIENPNAKIICIEINPLSAMIAKRILQALDETGKIRKGQIQVIQGDALSLPIEPTERIDLLISETVGPGLLDEQVVRILPRYAQHLDREKGVAIPARVRLSAALVPASYQSAMAEDERQVQKAKLDKKNVRRKYGIVLDTNGREHLVQPDEEWQLITDQSGIDLTEPISTMQGTIAIPAGMSLKELHNNYTVSICAELILDSNNKRVLPRYQSAPTTPISLDFVSIPADLMNTDPQDLEIHFKFTPGSPSGAKSGNVWVERKR